MLSQSCARFSNWSKADKKRKTKNKNEQQKGEKEEDNKASVDLISARSIEQLDELLLLLLLLFALLLPRSVSFAFCVLNSVSSIKSATEAAAAAEQRLQNSSRMRTLSFLCV